MGQGGWNRSVTTNSTRQTNPSDHDLAHGVGRTCTVEVIFGGMWGNIRPLLGVHFLFLFYFSVDVTGDDLDGEASFRGEAVLFLSQLLINV